MIAPPTVAAALLSLMHVATFVFYNSLYGRMRAGDRYKEGRDVSFSQMPVKRKITKIAFAANAALVLASFWIPENLPGFLNVSWSVRVIGLAISFGAVLFLKKSLSYLGENYSPLFDSHKPFRIVREGPYRAIRHPVYLANILIILGYVVASASFWSLILGAWGWFYMAWSIAKEERFLTQSFPEYEEYRRESRMLIPYLF